MRRWRVLSLVAVLVAAFMVWQTLPRPVEAQETTKLAPGVTLKIDKKFDGLGIPGVKEIMAGRVLMAPGSTWSDKQDSKTWDFCFQQVGPMIVVADGKTSTIATGTLWWVPPGTKFTLTNKSKVTVVDAFWEVTLK